MFFDKRSGKADFPSWELNVPRLGTKHSQVGKKFALLQAMGQGIC
jgi:hypothetical protein